MTLSKLPSLETLAVELNIPTLLKMSTHGHTSESVSQMKFDEAEKNGVSTEEYMRLKAYFNTHKSQSLAGNNQEKDRKLTLDVAPTTDPDDLPLSQLMPIAAPAMPYHQQQPGAVQPMQYTNIPQNGQPAPQNHPHQQAYQPQGYPQPYQQYPAAQPTVIVVNTPAPDDSNLACIVVGGLLVSLFFSPIWGLIGCCLGSKRQRGAWLSGSGSGGIFHSISYFIIGSAFQSSARFYDSLVFSPSDNSDFYNSTNEYNKSLANSMRGGAIAFYVLGSILLIACIAEIIVGNRLMRNNKKCQPTQMTV